MSDLTLEPLLRIRRAVFAGAPDKQPLPLQRLLLCNESVMAELTMSQSLVLHTSGLEVTPCLTQLNMICPFQELSSFPKCCQEL